MGKVAIVTGGGSGIGKGIARILLQSGYDVAVSYNTGSIGAFEIVEYAKAIQRKAVAIKADISKISGIKGLFEEFAANFDSLDLFVNNAGVTLKSDFLHTDENLFDSICNVDFKGAFFCMQEAAKFMIGKNTCGSIIAISSNNSVANYANVSVYGAIKAGLNKMCEHIALELARYKIRVNCISPGWTDTGANRMSNKLDTLYKIPLKKWTSPEEIGKAVLFLDSDSASSITGINLVMDNGAILLSDNPKSYGL